MGGGSGGGVGGTLLSKGLIAACGATHRGQDWGCDRERRQGRGGGGVLL